MNLPWAIREPPRRNIGSQKQSVAGGLAGDRCPSALPFSPPAGPQGAKQSIASGFSRGKKSHQDRARNAGGTRGFEASQRVSGAGGDSGCLRRAGTSHAASLSPPGGSSTGRKSMPGLKSGAIACMTPPGSRPIPIRPIGAELGRRAQPPYLKNRMSGGAGERRGAIPGHSTRSWRFVSPPGFRRGPPTPACRGSTPRTWPARPLCSNLRARGAPFR